MTLPVTVLGGLAAALPRAVTTVPMNHKILLDAPADGAEVVLTFSIRTL